MPRFASLRACLFSLVLAALPGAAGAQSKPFDQLLPEGALVFVTIRDLRAAEKWLETSPLQEAWKHADVQALVKSLKERFEKEMAAGGDGADTKAGQRDFADFWSCLGGEAAFAVGDISKLDPKSLQKEPPLAVLANVGRDKDKARDVLRRLTQKARDKKTNNVSEIEFRGQKITVIEETDKKDKEGDGGGGDEQGEGGGEKSSDSAVTYTVQADDLFVLGTSKTLVQDILANRTETAVKPLAENADYKLVREKVGKDATLTVYLGIGKLLESFAKLAQASGEPEAQQVAMFLPGVSGLLGLSNLKGMGVGVTLGKEDILQQLYVSISGAPRGLVKVFWTKPTALKLPALIPDDADSATVFQYSPDALWEAVQGIAKLAAQFLPQPGEGDGAGGPVDPIAQAEQMLGISFKQDLIGPLGGQFLEMTRFKRPFNLQSQESAFLLDIKDREKFQATIDKVLAMVPFFKKADYLGRAIYTFSMGGPGEPGDEDEGDAGNGDDKDKSPGAGSAPAPALAITENHFVFAMKKPLAEEVIRRIGKEVKSINDAPGFKAVAGQLPATGIVISYTSPQYVEYMVDMVRDLAKTAASGDEEDAETAELISKLPAGSVFSKPIAGFISHGTTEDAGLSFTSKLLFKKKE